MCYCCSTNRVRFASVLESVQSENPLKNEFVSCFLLFFGHKAVEFHTITMKKKRGYIRVHYQVSGMHGAQKSNGCMRWFVGWYRSRKRTRERRINEIKTSIAISNVFVSVEFLLFIWRNSLSVLTLVTRCIFSRTVQYKCVGKVMGEWKCLKSK